MTTFYNFQSKAHFLECGGKDKGDYVEDGIGISVIGDSYLAAPDHLPEDYVPTFTGYLVNTSAVVENWQQFVVVPSSPIRLFG